MPRGQGKHAHEAMQSGKLSAFIKPQGESADNANLPDWVDWGEVDSGLIAGSVISVNREGGSLLFGHTRDKKSYSIVLFYGGDKTSYYFPCTGDGVATLSAFLYSLASLSG